jgi:hypothetical protein
MSRLGSSLSLVCLSLGLWSSACSSSDPAPGGEAGGASGAPSGADAEPPALAGITAAHNVARAHVSPAANPAIPPLTWAKDVAATAQAWANRCKFEHGTGGKYGENIYASGGQDVTAAAVVDSWVGEAKDYDYAATACSGVCGHYTQVVWRKSTGLGCGVAKCSTSSPFSGFPEWQLVVCNYDPPGNFAGERPY